jgi:hypothetical protein
MKMIGCEDDYTTPDGRVRTPNALCDREFQAQKLINGISQHIARVERAWHKALDILQKLQERRARLAAGRPAAALREIREAPSKIAEQSHPRGDRATLKGVAAASSLNSDVAPSYEAVEGNG